MGTVEQMRRYWDADAPTYDRSPRHRPTSPAVQAAWLATVERLLPAAPARVLDCGAGTGFVTLMAARLGHRVTALDLSPGMLGVLGRSARREGLDVDIVEGPADRPTGNFDAVIERHLVWALPDPRAALGAWRTAAPGGRLVLLESLWGDAAAGRVGPDPGAADPRRPACPRAPRAAAGRAAPPAAPGRRHPGGDAPGAGDRCRMAQPKGRASGPRREGRGPRARPGRAPGRGPPSRRRGRRLTAGSGVSPRAARGAGPRPSGAGRRARTRRWARSARVAPWCRSRRCRSSGRSVRRWRPAR